MKKLAFIVLFLLLIVVRGECATLYARNVTANWGTASTWSTTGSGGAGDGSVPTNADDVIFDSGYTGDITTAGANRVCKSLVCQTGATGTFAIGSGYQLTVSGNFTLVSGMTYTFPTNSTLTFNASTTITCAGKYLPGLYFNAGGGTFTLGDDLYVAGGQFKKDNGTFNPNSKSVILIGTGTQWVQGDFTGTSSLYNLTRTGDATKTCALYFTANTTISNILTLNGNSGINRLLIYSSVLGTARTLTAATVSVTNADFRDITGAGAGSWDLSAISGGSGDCGGNTGITFTTADDWYWNGSGTRNFSDYTYWYTATNGGGSQMASTRCPLPQDTCYINGDSIDGATTIDQDLPRIPGIDCTGAGAFNLHINNIAQTCYGSLTLVSNVTLTNGSDITFEGRGAYSFTPVGTGWQNVSISAVGGSLQLGGTLAISDAKNLTLNNGFFDANDQNITTRTFSSSNSNARKLLMGNGTWTFTPGENSDSWVMTTTTNLDLSAGMAEGSTIVLNNLTRAVNFYGGGLTYNDITINTSTGVPTFIANNTFNTFTINAPKTVKLTAGTTTTVSSLVATGDASNLIHIDSTSASAATLHDDSGTNTVHYCHIGETGAVNAEGGATWDASDNCQVNSSTGWTVATANTTNFFMFFNY